MSIRRPVVVDLEPKTPEPASPISVDQVNAAELIAGHDQAVHKILDGVPAQTWTLDVEVPAAIVEAVWPYTNPQHCYGNPVKAAAAVAALLEAIGCSQ